MKTNKHMKIGSDYLNSLKTHHATVFEALYCIATAIGDWPAAVKTFYTLYERRHISLNRKLSYHRELISTGDSLYATNNFGNDSQDLDPLLGHTYTYRTKVTISTADPDACNCRLISLLSNDELIWEASKFKVIDGAPVCGIEELDEYVISREEISKITEGLDGLITRTILSELAQSRDKEIQDREKIISALDSELSALRGVSSEVNPRSKGFVSSLLFLCAQQIIGEKVAEKLTSREIARALVKKLSAGKEKNVASVEGLVDYIEMGRSKVDP